MSSQQHEAKIALLGDIPSEDIWGTVYGFLAGGTYADYPVGRSVMRLLTEDVDSRFKTIRDLLLVDQDLVNAQPKRTQNEGLSEYAETHLGRKTIPALPASSALCCVSSALYRVSQRHILNQELKFRHDFLLPYCAAAARLRSTRQNRRIAFQKLLTGSERPAGVSLDQVDAQFNRAMYWTWSHAQDFYRTQVTICSQALPSQNDSRTTISEFAQLWFNGFGKVSGDFDREKLEPLLNIIERACDGEATLDVFFPPYQLEAIDELCRGTNLQKHSTAEQNRQGEEEYRNGVSLLVEGLPKAAIASSTLTAQDMDDIARLGSSTSIDLATSILAVGCTHLSDPEDPCHCGAVSDFDLVFKQILTNRWSLSPKTAYTHDWIRRISMAKFLLAAVARHDMASSLALTDESSTKSLFGISSSSLPIRLRHTLLTQMGAHFRVKDDWFAPTWAMQMLVKLILLRDPFILLRLAQSARVSQPDADVEERSEEDTYLCKTLQHHDCFYHMWANEGPWVKTHGGEAEGQGMILLGLMFPYLHMIESFLRRHGLTDAIPIYALLFGPLRQSPSPLCDFAFKMQYVRRQYHLGKVTLLECMTNSPSSASPCEGLCVHHTQLSALGDARFCYKFPLNFTTCLLNGVRTQRENSLVQALEPIDRHLILNTFLGATEEAATVLVPDAAAFERIYWATLHVAMLPRQLLCFDSTNLLRTFGFLRELFHPPRGPQEDEMWEAVADRILIPLGIVRPVRDCYFKKVDKMVLTAVIPFLHFLGKPFVDKALVALVLIPCGSKKQNALADRIQRRLFLSAP